MTAPPDEIVAKVREWAAHADWADTIKDAEELTPFAITARYPGDYEPVTEPEARRAIEIAAQVRGTVRSALGAENVAQKN